MQIYKLKFNFCRNITFFRQQKIVCVECLRPVDGNVRCPDCNFPICSLDCIAASKIDEKRRFDEKLVDTIDTKCEEVDELGHSLKWHQKFECRLLSEVGFKAAERTEKCRPSAATEVPPLLVQVR